MSTLNQYRTQLESALYRWLNINLTISPRPMHEITVTTPNLLDSLMETYGLSYSDLQYTYRLGVGRKLSMDDSFVFQDMTIEKPKVAEAYGGIICPLGILSFYEDIFYQKKGGGDVKILAASYHFQTAPQNENHPLYIRFEFDPFVTNPPRNFEEKPIFHYHFSNYDLFHKHCHFSAGHFNLSDSFPFHHADPQQYFKLRDAPSLESFLKLLDSAELI